MQHLRLMYLVDIQDDSNLRDVFYLRITLSPQWGKSDDPNLVHLNYRENLYG